MGRGGKLDLTIDFVRAVNGDKIALRAVKEASGGGHVGAMTGGIVAASILFFPAAPLFLFMQGKDITIPQGTEVTAYSNGEIALNAAGLAAKPAVPATPAAAPAASKGPNLTNADVVRLKEAGFSDDLIVSKIKASGADYKVEVNDLMDLKKANISDAVITAMIEASKQAVPAAPAVAAPASQSPVEFEGEQQWPGLRFTISFTKGVKEITNLKLRAACLEGGTKFEQTWFSPFPIAADGSFTSVGVPGSQAGQKLTGNFRADESAEGVFETGIALGCTKDAASRFKISGNWQARPQTPASVAPVAAATSATSAESVHPLHVELGKPVAIAATGLEITLTKIQVAGGPLAADSAFNVAKGRIDVVSGGMPPRRSVRPGRQSATPENASVLSIVGTIDQGKPNAFWALDSWITNEGGQRSVPDDMAGLSSGREFTLMFNVPAHPGALRLNIGESLAIDLAPFLDRVSAPATQRKPIAPTAPVVAGAGAETAEVNDLFLLAGGPVAVSLTRHADGTWFFTPDQQLAGAAAKIRMTHGAVFELVWKAETDVPEVTTTGLKKNLTLTGTRLPNGTMIIGIASERLYGGRFRFVFDGAVSKLFFIDELEKPTAPVAPVAATSAEQPRKVEPIHVTLGQTVEIPGSDLEVTLTNVKIAAIDYNAAGFTKPSGDPLGVLTIVGQVTKGQEKAFWNLNSWIADDEDRRIKDEGHAGLSRGREFTLLNNVPMTSRKLRLHLGDSLVIDLTPFLDPVSALDVQQKPITPTAPPAVEDVAATCSGGWEPITARVPGAKVALTVSTRDRQEWLEWPNPTGDDVDLQIGKAKAPVNAQGEIATCATRQVFLSRGSTSESVRNLLVNLQPGYYAVRVTVGSPRADDPANTSEWITVQLKKTERAAPVSTAPAPVAAVPGERTLNLNGSPIQVREDQVNAMRLAGSSDTFTDKSGRKVVIQDFEFDKKGAKYVVNAKMTLEEGQTTTIPFDRACRGLVGNDAKVKHSRTHESSNGSLDLAQVGEDFVFHTTSGSVKLGVSFDLDSALTGDLEGHTSFDYFTVGSKVHAGSDIRIANCRQ